MNNENVFDILIPVVFSISLQLGLLGTKSQELVISFRLVEGETLPQFHLIYLQVRSENFLLQD